MKKLAWILVLLGLLAGCSARTRYAFLVDIQSFLADQSEGALDLGTPIAFDIYLPDNDNDYTTPYLEGYLAEIPSQVVDFLEALKIDLGATLENQGSALLSLTARLYLAPESERDIYQPPYKIAEYNLGPLNPGETGELRFQLNFVEGDPAYRTVKEGEGRFRVGLRLSGSGEAFRYRIETFTLYLKAKPLGQLFQSN